MSDFKMKCPECSFDFEGKSQTEYVTCPNCNKEILTVKAIKYFQTFEKIANENKIIAMGENYQKLNSLLEECKWYIDNAEYENALMVSEEALSLSNVDDRVYMMRVYAKTKNFTDFEDNSHFHDLKMAIELSSEIERENIKKIYAPYHRKRIIPKEEFEEYENQEADSKLKRVESMLKDGIPKHFSREKSLKILLPSVISSFVIFITLLILSLIFNDFILSLVSTAIFIANFILFTYYLTQRKNVICYNAVLDLYDTLPSFNLKPHLKLEVSKLLEKFAVSHQNGESLAHIDVILFETVENLVQNPTSKNFVINNKTFKKYL